MAKGVNKPQMKKSFEYELENIIFEYQQQQTQTQKFFLSLSTSCVLNLQVIWSSTIAD